MVCRCTSQYTDSQSVQSCEEADYESRLSVLLDRYCRQLYAGFLTNEEVKVDVDLSCIDFSYGKVWFIQHTQNLSTDLEFEVQNCQTGHKPSARKHVILTQR